jgi:purine-binding chemotaxis protein CheW
VSGYIVFRLAGRELACRTEEVREVVRLAGLQVLPGMPAGISGLLELRGDPLPVVDVRLFEGEPPSRGDVLVLAEPTEPIGIVVDRVTAVYDDEALTTDAEKRPSGLPHYVVEVLRRGMGGGPVLLVDLRGLMSVAAA